jgi:hypothetical protein
MESCGTTSVDSWKNECVRSRLPGRSPSRTSPRWLLETSNNFMLTTELASGPSEVNPTPVDGFPTNCPEFAHDGSSFVGRFINQSREIPED